MSRLHHQGHSERPSYLNCTARITNARIPTHIHVYTRQASYRQNCITRLIRFIVTIIISLSFCSLRTIFAGRRHSICPIQLGDYIALASCVWEFRLWMCRTRRRCTKCSLSVWVQFGRAVPILENLQLLTPPACPIG